VATYPAAEDSRDRLHRAGWSVGEVGSAAVGWWVTGTNRATSRRGTASGGGRVEAPAGRPPPGKEGVR
jgi:hypothetical protein